LARGNFAATIRDWRAKVQIGTEAVFHGSVHEVLATANREQPIVTGFLVGSLAVGRNVEPAQVTTIRSPNAWESELVGLKIGERARARWTAHYAVPVEFGTPNQRAHGAVRRAVDDWLNIVKRNEDKVRATLGL
jgi:hypothetical protein